MTGSVDALARHTDTGGPSDRHSALSWTVPMDVRTTPVRVTGRRNRLLALALWKRDDGLCGRCVLPIDPTLHHSLPGALTIGHIVPHSQGGTYDPRNLRPEHARCNKAAGTRDTRPVAAIVTP